MIAYPYFLITSLLALAAAVLYKKFFSKKTTYLFSSLHIFDKTNSDKSYTDKIIFILRALAITSLALALARFQIPDKKTKIPVEGVDIMLVLDISHSMLFFDDQNDTRSRLDVAKSEALKFVQKREHDPIGLVLFAQGIVSRCPLTLDKNILTTLLKETEIGLVNPQGTYLSWGIVTAANRLKNSTAKSKIMIVLTDGEPTQGDADPKFAIDLAKKLGIKIYTIGVGSESGGYINHPMFGVIKVPNKLNVELLKFFAESTGGSFFAAHNPKELEKIYQTINELEKTENQAPVYAKYFEYFPYFLWIAFIILFIEVILTSLVWVRL